MRKLIAAAVMAVAACQGQAPVKLANPASTHCVEKGGLLQLETRPDGGTYGVCRFEGNRQCEEWALFRGDCPMGGIKVTGYATDAARYCAITGGTYDVVADAGPGRLEQGTCTPPGGGEVCDVYRYHDGGC